MVDADTLRAIPDAQATQQQKTLNAGATPTAALTTVFVTKSLSAHLPEFIYDLDNGGRFNVWCNCYEDIIAKDGSTLDDVARARLVVSKLDAATFARFTIQILPKKTSDVSLDETVKTFKELFRHNTSVFACRYVYLRAQRNDETLRDYPDWSITS
ncbi:hypothetical protein ANCCAN_25611 [Ancylostoma caninum]|uniref:DUF7083 domain-containing protein n=1 Tax=Ancylostoma caninum TaxID=29170 RepID=A0A368F958_ANCCA|nr:hypothetical protein ANCCAN_25611 [Ancylostoma caninum]